MKFDLVEPNATYSPNFDMIENTFEETFKG